MTTWVLYDIAEDKSRNQVARWCKQAGLYRVQYSVFLGQISENEADELGLQIESVIDLDVDKVYIFPMCKQDLKNTVLLGQAFDKALITDRIQALWL